MEDSRHQKLVNSLTDDSLPSPDERLAPAATSGSSSSVAPNIWFSPGRGNQSRPPFENYPGRFRGGGYNSRSQMRFPRGDWQRPDNFYQNRNHFNQPRYSHPRPYQGQRQYGNFNRPQTSNPGSHQFNKQPGFADSIENWVSSSMWEDPWFHLMPKSSSLLPPKAAQIANIDIPAQIDSERLCSLPNISKANTDDNPGMDVI